MNTTDAIIPFDVRDEDEYRLRKVFLSMRELACFFRNQPNLPQTVVFPDLNLPAGWQCRGARLSEFGHGVEVLVYHPSFSPVPEGSEIPRFDADRLMTFRMYHLATEDEVKSRGQRGDVSPPAGPVDKEDFQILTQYKISGFKIPDPSVQNDEKIKIDKEAIKKSFDEYRSGLYRHLVLEGLPAPGEEYWKGAAPQVYESGPPKSFRDRVGLPSSDDVQKEILKTVEESGRIHEDVVRVTEQIEKVTIGTETTMCFDPESPSGCSRSPKQPTKVQSLFRFKNEPERRIMDLIKQDGRGRILCSWVVQEGTFENAWFDVTEVQVVRLSESGVPLSVRPLDVAEVFG